MSISDLDIYRTAKVAIDGHGASAIYLASIRESSCRARGDVEGGATWKRIAAAIEFLQAKEAPASGAKLACGAARFGIEFPKTAAVIARGCGLAPLFRAPK